MFYPELRDGPAMIAYQEMVKKLKEEASRVLRPDQIVMRPLRATDLGISTPDWRQYLSSTATWNTLASTQIANNRWIGINGVFYPQSAYQAITELQITAGGKIERYWSIQGINNYVNATGYADDPIIIGQNVNLDIKGYTINSSTETIVFIGMVVEKKGLTIG